MGKQIFVAFKYFSSVFSLTLQNRLCMLFHLNEKLATVLEITHLALKPDCINGINQIFLVTLLYIGIKFCLDKYLYEMQY